MASAVSKLSPAALQVTTMEGFTVEAPNMVLATHTPIHRNFTVISRQNPFRSYALGLKIPKVVANTRSLQLTLAVVDHERA